MRIFLLSATQSLFWQQMSSLLFPHGALNETHNWVKEVFQGISGCGLDEDLCRHARL
jgi:hypothetical protein